MHSFMEEGGLVCALPSKGNKSFPQDLEENADHMSTPLNTPNSQHRKGNPSFDGKSDMTF